MSKPFQPKNNNFKGDFEIEEIRAGVALHKQGTQRHWTWWVIVREATLLFTAVIFLAAASIYDMTQGTGWATVNVIFPWVTLALGYLFAAKTSADKTPDG